MSDPNEYNKKIIEEFHANEGRVGGFFADKLVLILHTKGAKSGKPRVAPAVYIPDEDRYIIIASAGGAPKHPGWYHNLVANPEVEVEVGTERFNGIATPAAEPERTELYDRMAGKHDIFSRYREETSREIPVVILTREG